RLPGNAQRHLGLGPDAEAQPVAQPARLSAEHVERDRAERDADLRGGDGHRLAGADEQRHPGPPPRVQGEADGYETLRRRVRVDALDLEVALVLAPNSVVRGQRA